ncbi:3-hydroxyisobutyryl-CoA hydrolase, mitochondrial [Agrilus planipennis]|uniref:3-hydroxyisobutyryl-CoA hydrolase, mitochondrial n=1 Tax=Agrilus planipennis TaxID=224129 RepID=A0A7F5QV27_AGRPL|nr:3-hydroxyisobutyryl-CoA hydrolase, mitochondrial-like [Agrilus planipennis]XP_025828911.1 3-hydroxyisobutyryl-CoA hydrolase, mitochondrial [Agrilus planipennis]
MLINNIFLYSRVILRRATLFKTVFPRNMSTSEEDVLFNVKNNKGIIILNRPKALNALNLSMVEKIHPKLLEWEKDKDFVLIKGMGDKAFCSGGDVRAVIVAGLKGDKLGHTFFRKEYTLNGLIGSYKIPYIALIDGIVMGGGVGLSIHGKYRVATERTIFAMPETMIGFFSDVGGSYFLPRMKGKLGWYLAITGHRLKGSDVLKAGIATHYCESTKLTDLENDLLSNGSDEKKVENILSKFSTDEKKLPEFSLNPFMDKINHCFGAPSVEEVIKRLQADGSDWAKQTLKVLSEVSPTSVKVIFKILELGATKDLKDCLEMEYQVASGCLANHDFYEGVRALLIDKDKNPKWKPKTYEEVTQEIVEKHFSSSTNHEGPRNKL